MINAYLFEGTVSLVPSGYYQGNSEVRQDPIQIWTGMIASQKWNSYQYPLLQRYAVRNSLMAFI